MSMAEAEPSQRDFLKALEDERRKIQMFSRELPLTLQLINEACGGGGGEWRSENASSERPVFQDFMPIKPVSSSSRSEGELNNEKGSSDCTPDLLRSVNLNDIAAADESSDERGTLRKPMAVNARRVWGAFQPFERNKLATAAAAAVPVPFTAPSVSSTTVMTTERRKDGGGEVEKEEERQSLVPVGPNRKHRRCWSPDLHRKFLNALEALGGSHLATPKQIREMMKVDSLTNDEVKSHLQKYRLHTKRPAATIHNSIETRTPPHFVLLGSIWVPPQEYTLAAAEAAERTEGSGAALKETCSPAASLLPLELRLQEEQSAKKQQRNRPSGAVQLERMDSQDDGSLLDDAATKSNSSSSSLSSQTTTVLPPL
ncbi:putative transcription factor GLK1 [Platanthera guangdongensis]|uniref:Transcription factor GLK1 n=1 Tax=Platanthera guangdongensis TaxID=2320717 RepID=A0ABR2MDH1_9ASPA